MATEQSVTNVESTEPFMTVGDSLRLPWNLAATCVTVTLPPILGQMVDGIAAKLGVNQQEVLLRALTLYGIALGYHEQGKQIGAAAEGQPQDVTFDMFKAGSHGG